MTRLSKQRRLMQPRTRKHKQKQKQTKQTKKQKPNNNEAARPKQEIQEVGRRTHLPQSE